jgi:hypothetical protein
MAAVPEDSEDEVFGGEDDPGPPAGAFASLALPRTGDDGPLLVAAAIGNWPG